MPPETLSTVKRQLGIVIKKFKFEELENTVMPCFPEITWNEVRTKLIEHHESFTVKSALRLIEYVINRANLEEAELRARLLTLEAIETSRHSKKKTWYGYALTGANKRTQDIVEHRKFQDKIQKTFLALNMQVDVKVVKYDGIIYVCLKEHPKSRPVRQNLPTYFALFAGERYFFCSKKTVSKKMVQAIVASMGYASTKQIKLTGKDLMSLMKILWNKEQKILNRDGIHERVTYREPKPRIKPTGTDYRQHEQRRSYAEQCFGTNAPVLENLVIDAPGQNWAHREIARKLPDEIHIGLEFHSRNIAQFLTTLVEQKVLVTPLPPYIADFMSGGKNELTLKRDRTSDRRSNN